MRLHRHRHGGPLVASAALALAAATPAHAGWLETAKAHGTVCVNRNIGGEEILFNTNGLANSSDTFDLQVFCPVATNLPTTNSQTTTLGASGPNCTSDPSKRPWIEVYDRNPTKDFSCTLFVMILGGAAQASFTVTSSSSGAAVQRLVFNADTLAMATGRYLVVRCDVPQKASDFSFVADIGVPLCQVTP
jgi:hypothetical protein